MSDEQEKSFHKNEIRQMILAKESQRNNRIFWATSDSRFAEIALQLLEDEDPKHVNAAIRALGKLSKLNPAQYVPEVSRLLDNPVYCAAAVRFIGEHGDKAFLAKRLLGFLQYPDEELRLLGLRTLANLPYTLVPNLLEIALLMLDDMSATIRATACMILGRFTPDERAVAALISRLGDNEIYLGRQTVAVVAAQWLRDISAVEALKAALPDADDELGDTIVSVLFELDGENLLPFMYEQLQKHRSEIVRMNIVRELSYYGDVSSVEPLMQVMLRHPDEAMQELAASSLRILGEPQGMEAAEKWRKELNKKRLRQRYGLPPKN